MRRRRPAINALIMVGLAVAVLGGAIAIKIWLDSGVRGPDLCIPGMELGQTIVFIDKTDMWNANQSERLKEHVLEVLHNDMKEEERLRVFSFGESILAGFKPRYSACKPPDGRKCRGLLCNVKELEKQYHERFIDPLSRELETLKMATQGACSPIAEALFDVMGRSEIKSHPGPTRIILISDMVQNTPVYSGFKNPQPACPGVSAKADPDKDNGLQTFFEKRKAEMNLSAASGRVYQVIPERRSADVGDRARAKWTEVFQILSVKMGWDKL